MCIQSLLDQELPLLHGNRQGLSYGQLAVLLLTYILTQADHRLCAVESWVRQHHQTLEMAKRPQHGGSHSSAIALQSQQNELSPHKVMP